MISYIARQYRLAGVQPGRFPGKLKGVVETMTVHKPGLVDSNVVADEGYGQQSQSVS